MVDAVALKLPTFWAQQPDVWFHQAHFYIRKITKDETKYYYVVAALDQTTAGRLQDTLSKPSTSVSSTPDQSLRFFHGKFGRQQSQTVPSSL